MFDTIVVGAGPAGSTTAAILARMGGRVLVLDRARFPRTKPCGDYLNPGCDAVLWRLGVRDAVVRIALPVPGMRIFTPNGGAVTAAFSAGTGYALPRRDLDQLLVTHAAACGAHVVEEARVVGLTREAGQMRVSVERGRCRREQYRARLVVGADGLQSAVARMIGAGGSLRSGRFTIGAYLDGLAGPVPGAEPPPGEVHLGRNRYCGVAYLPGGFANVTVALPRDDLRASRGTLEERYWSSLRRFPGLADRLARAAVFGGFRTSGPLGFWRRRSSGEGVLLVGDAAAFIDPMTGQGVYLALRGAELAAAAAARALGAGGPTARALAPYDHERRREFRNAFLVSRLLQRLAFLPPMVHRAGRQMAIHPDLSARLINAVGNAEPAAGVLHPWFIARMLGAG